MWNCENKSPTPFNKTCIDKDLLRVMPTHAFYSQEFKYGIDSLRRVLECLSIYHEDLGYFNSIGFITAILLLYLPEEDTFWMANYLLDWSMIRKWIVQDRDNIKVTLYIFQKLWATKMSKIYVNLHQNQVNPMFYASSWFMTLFWSKFNMEWALRILDMLFVEGYVWWFKIALAILLVKTDKLETGNFEEILLALNTNLS